MDAPFLAFWLVVAAFGLLAVRYFRTRREAHRLLRAAQESDRLKDEFLALVSHELRTPLTSIRGYLELVLDDPSLAEEQRRYLQIVARNSERLQHLVSDLLLVAQIETAGLTVAREPVEIDRVAEECVEAACPQAEARDVELHLDANARAEIAGDRMRLGQLLDNLVSNAIKFTPAGGRVDVRTHREDGHVVAEVSDTGMGIPADEQARLFERFFRTSTATREAVQGTGLGLTIARAIAHAHDGAIDFTSREGEGTTFRVRLPFRER